MAVDLVTLAPIYDVAVLVGGDADHAPAVIAAKRLGKTVLGVRLFDTDNVVIPGVSKAIREDVDWTLDLLHGHLTKLLVLPS